MEKIMKEPFANRALLSSALGASCNLIFTPAIRRNTVNQIDVYAEWQNLCEEDEAARDANFQALAIVNQKFSAIGQGTSGRNPTEDELSEFERTWPAWIDIKKRMDTFVKQYA
jgi:hypothetical protein